VLTKAVLATALGCEPRDIRPQVIAPLGKEASIEEDSEFIYTRHRTIAEAAVKILTERDRCDFDEIYKKLLEAAIRTWQSGTYVPDLGIWRSLPQRLSRMGNGKRRLAVSLAEQLIRLEPTDPLHVTQLARLYRDSGQAERSVEPFREAFENIPPQRRDCLFFHEWGTAEGKNKNFYMSARLDGISLADTTPPPKREDRYNATDYIKIALNGLAIAFEGLAKQTGNRDVFVQTWGAAVRLASQLPANLVTEDTEIRVHQSYQRWKKLGKADVPLYEALNVLLRGIAATEQATTSEGSRLPNVSQLTYHRLALALGLTD
jgi:tetratricopeptide (TPR) repeat protein